MIQKSIKGSSKNSI